MIRDGTETNSALESMGDSCILRQGWIFLGAALLGGGAGLGLLLVSRGASAPSKTAIRLR